MSDRIDKATRSRVMAKVKNRGTRLEALCALRLRDGGWGRLEWHALDLPGTPDFVLRDLRVAIFVDSCFWHGCPKHLRMPTSNVVYWSSKIAMNRARDKRVSAALRRAGWAVVRIWEHDLRDERAWDRARRRIQRTRARRIAASAARP